MSHLAQLRCALTADSDSRGLVQVGHLVHVVIGAGIRDAGGPGDPSRVGLSGDKATRILGQLLLDRPVEVKVGLDLGGLLLLELGLELLGVLGEWVA